MIRFLAINRDFNLRFFHKNFLNYSFFHSPNISLYMLSLSVLKSSWVFVKIYKCTSTDQVSIFYKSYSSNHTHHSVFINLTLEDSSFRRFILKSFLWKIYFEILSFSKIILKLFYLILFNHFWWFHTNWYTPWNYIW